MTGPDDRQAMRQARSRVAAAERRARDAEAQLAAAAAHAAGDMNALIRAAARDPGRPQHDPAAVEAAAEPVGEFTPGVREALPPAPDMNALLRAARYYPTEPAP